MRVEASDAIDGASATLTSNGWNIVRAFLVFGQDGNPDFRLVAAAQTAGVPRYGDPHPSVAGLRCVEIRPEAMDQQNSQFRVLCTYRIPEVSDGLDGDRVLGDVELDSATVQDQTFTDRGGNLMKVTMRGPVELTNQDGSEALQPGTFTTVIQGSIERPQVAVRVVRSEAVAPLASAVRFQSKINRSRWSGGEAHTWLCRRIGAVRSNGGRYQVTYEFVYDPQTWRLRGAVNVGGIIPANARVGNGIEYFDVYDTEEFAALGIVLPL